MHPSAASFRECVTATYGFEPEIHEFEDGTKTAADAAAAIGCDLAQIASSIVMEAAGSVVVVVTSGANRASEDRIAAHLDAASVELADPEAAKAATGWSIGGVPPICHETELPVLFDETLLEHREVWAAAGTPEAVFPIDPERLVDLSAATVLDVA